MKGFFGRRRTTKGMKNKIILPHSFKAVNIQMIIFLPYNKNYSGNIILQQHSTTDYKGAVFQNEATTTTTISSPARRSEISPIQIHVSFFITL